jgi:hypothetical protein
MYAYKTWCCPTSACRMTESTLIHAILMLTALAMWHTSCSRRSQRQPPLAAFVNPNHVHLRAYVHTFASTTAQQTELLPGSQCAEGYSANKGHSFLFLTESSQLGRQQVPL